MKLFKLSKKQKNIFLILIIFIITLTSIIFLTHHKTESTTENQTTLPYEREFEKSFSLKEKFDLSKEYFHYENSDYLTYFPDIEWDEAINFIKMPTDLVLTENTPSKLTFQNCTSFLKEELELFKLFYDLEEEILRQEYLVENGQEVYDFSLYDEITLKINEQEKKVSTLKQPNETSTTDNKEHNSHLLLALHLLTSQANNFETFIHEYHQLQELLISYLETIEIYTQIILTETSVNKEPLQILKAQTEEEIKNMYIFYKDPKTLEHNLLGKLDVNAIFDMETNTLKTQIIFEYNQGQFDKKFSEFLKAITEDNQ